MKKTYLKQAKLVLALAVIALSTACADKKKTPVADVPPPVTEDTCISTPASCPLGQQSVSGQYLASARSQINAERNKLMDMKLVFFATEATANILVSGDKSVILYNGPVVAKGSVFIRYGQYQDNIDGVQFNEDDINVFAPPISARQAEVLENGGYIELGLDASIDLSLDPGNGSGKGSGKGSGRKKVNACALPAGDYTVVSSDTADWEQSFISKKRRITSSADVSSLTLQLSGNGNVIDATLEGSTLDMVKSSESGYKRLNGVLTINRINKKSCNTEIQL